MPPAVPAIAAGLSGLAAIPAGATGLAALGPAFTAGLGGYGAAAGAQKMMQPQRPQAIDRANVTGQAPMPQMPAMTFQQPMNYMGMGQRGQQIDPLMLLQMLMEGGGFDAPQRTRSPFA